MLASVFDAIRVKGRSNKAIAAACNRHSQTVTAWFSGRIYIPLRVRNSLCEAIGAEIDWAAYEAEFASAQERRAARPAPRLVPDPAPAGDHAPHDAPPPQLPRPAPARPPAAPQARHAPRPAEKPQARPVPPPVANTGKGGIFGFLSTPKPSTDEKGLFDFT